MKVKALLFSAGLGTRLRPLTNEKPKALVEVNGKSLLEWNIIKLLHYGIQDIVVKIHHFPQLMKTALAELSAKYAVNITISDESDEVLETGGGLKKAAPHFKDTDVIIVHNVDILSDVNFTTIIEQHIAHPDNLATLCIQKRTSSRYLLFDDTHTLCGWENIKTGEQIIKRTSSELAQYAFSGIQIISPKLLPLITQEGKFSIIDTYLSLAETGRIKGLHIENNWFDVGSIEKLEHTLANFEKLSFNTLNTAS